MIKLNKSEKFKTLAVHSIELSKLGDYLSDILVRFNGCDDKGVLAFYKGLDNSIRACINEVLELDDYVETFDNLKVDRGFIVDRLFECFYLTTSLEDVETKLTCLVDEMNEQGVEILEVEIEIESA